MKVKLRLNIVSRVAFMAYVGVQMVFLIIYMATPSLDLLTLLVWYFDLLLTTYVYKCK